MTLLSLITLVLWLMSLGRTILNLLLIPRLGSLRPGPMRGSRAPRVSVIIPARDEERAIERTVRAMLAQTWPELEIVVVNDRSTDGTAAILAGLSDPRLVVISGEEPPAGWLGKPWALHQGSRHSTGELLLFVDADVHYEPDAIRLAVEQLEATGASLVSLFPSFVMRGFWEQVVMPNLTVFAFSFLPLWLANRSRLRVLAVGGGPGNLVRRDRYEECHGHLALRDAVVDDVALSRLLRVDGHRTAVVRADRHVSVRMYHGLGEVVDGFTKNSFAVFGYNYVVAAAILVMAMVFHLVPYALALTGDPLAIATVVVIAVTRLLLFATFRYHPLNALLGHPLMIAVWCWIVLRSVWLTGIRRRLLWRGRTYDARGTRFGG